MNRMEVLIASAVGLAGACLFNIQWALHFLYFVAAFAVFGVLGYGIVSIIKALKK